MSNILPQLVDANNTLSLLATAIRYRDAGLSVIPIQSCLDSRGVFIPNLAKRPALKGWKQFQQDFPTESIIRTWFNDSFRGGVAVICGAVSRLLVIDFDDADAWDDYLRILPPDLLAIVEQCAVSRTPRPGYHLWLRCHFADVPGGEKLALRLDANDPKKPKCKVETRGEGNYILAPGTPAECHEMRRPYVWVRDALDSAPDLDLATVNRLLDYARMLNECPNIVSMLPPNRGGENVRGLPGHDYCHRVGWDEILVDHDWTQSTVVSLTDKEVTHWTRPGKDGGTSATSGYCFSENYGDLLYVFSSNAEPFETGKTYTKFAAYTLLNHGSDFKAAARALRQQGYGGLRDVAGDCVTVNSEPSQLLLDVDEHRCVAQGMENLSKLTHMYERAGRIVEVTANPSGREFRPVSADRLRTLLTSCCDLRQRTVDKAGDLILKPVHPPGWLYRGIANARPSGFRPIKSIVHHPIFLPDFRILAVNGYHEASGLYLDLPSDLTVNVPEFPSVAELKSAVGELDELVCDFPFAADEFRSAWIAALLSPLVLFAHAGNTPFFLIDKNVRGCGASKLADLVGTIVHGHSLPRAVYSRDPEEMRKSITSLAIADKQLVLLDNLSGSIGDPVFDAALTGERRWTDRLLGSNERYDGPLDVIFIGTGNNCPLSADLSRRTCLVRMVSLHERPEERSGFRHANLLDFARNQRGRLLSAALTILRAWAVAGCPKGSLVNWGSFESWSDIVRAAIVHAGWPDPGLARTTLNEETDLDAQSMQALIRACELVDPSGGGVTVKHLLDRLQEEVSHAQIGFAEERVDICSAALNGAEHLCGGSVNPVRLGQKLGDFRSRNFGGKTLIIKSRSHGVVRWGVRSLEVVNV